MSLSMRPSVVTLTPGPSSSFARSLAFACACLGASACGRTPEAKPDAPSPALKTPPSTAPAPVAAQAAPATTGYKLPGSPRVVAIGDIHGDLTALRGALRLAGAIDSDDRWIGKDLTVVQTG